MKKLNMNDKLLNAILYALVGLLLIIFRSSSLGILMTIIGILLIAYGIYDILNQNDKTQGIISAVIGVIIIVCGWTIADIVLLILGILMIARGIIDLLHTYKLDIKFMLPAIFTIVIGVMLVIARWALMDVFCIIAGVVFIIDAVLIIANK